MRNANSLLPLKLSPEERVLAILPRPKDLTPADTSSFEKPQLGEALRRYHPHVDEVTVSLDPSPQELAALREQASGYSLVVVGTINAMEHKGQADLVNGLLDAGTKVVAVSLRLPYDLQAYPAYPPIYAPISLQPASSTRIGRRPLGTYRMPGSVARDSRGRVEGGRVALHRAGQCAVARDPPWRHCGAGQGWAYCERGASQ